MSPPEIFALREYFGPELKGRTISDARHGVSLTDIFRPSCLIGRSRELSGRSVQLATSGELLSALRTRRRRPPHPSVPARPRSGSHPSPACGCGDRRHRLTDQPLQRCDAGAHLVVGAGLPGRAAVEWKTGGATEWPMLTSGTSGLPKIVGHTPDGLTLQRTLLRQLGALLNFRE
jgi:hypothetical protein